MLDHYDFFYFGHNESVRMDMYDVVSWWTCRKNLDFFSRVPRWLLDLIFFFEFLECFWGITHYFSRVLGILDFLWALRWFFFFFFCCPLCKIIGIYASYFHMKDCNYLYSWPNYICDCILFTLFDGIDHSITHWSHVFFVWLFPCLFH